MFKCEDMFGTYYDVHLPTVINWINVFLSLIMLLLLYLNTTIDTTAKTLTTIVILTIVALSISDLYRFYHFDTTITIFEVVARVSLFISAIFIPFFVNVPLLLWIIIFLMISHLSYNTLFREDWKGYYETYFAYNKQEEDQQ